MKVLMLLLIWNNMAKGSLTEDKATGLSLLRTFQIQH